jgi:hypothetical protein
VSINTNLGSRECNIKSYIIIIVLYYNIIYIYIIINYKYYNMYIYIIYIYI